MISFAFSFMSLFLQLKLIFDAIYVLKSEDYVAIKIIGWYYLKNLNICHRNFKNSGVVVYEVWLIFEAIL